jgi:MFS family permease
MGALADRFGPARPVAAGMFCGALALLVVAAAGPQPPILVGCLAILGALANGTPAVLLSATPDVAAQVVGVGTGSALGITRLALSLGPAVSPTIIGFLFLAVGGTTTELLLACVFATAGALAIAVLTGLRQGRAPSAPAARAAG